MTSSPATPSSRPPASRLADWALARVAPLFALGAGGVLALVVGFVLREAAPLVHGDGLARLAGPAWSPTQGRLGLLPMALGSLACAGGALALAGPLGLGVAVFQRFFAPPWARRALGAALDLLASVPSIVFAVWGLVVVVPLLGRLAPPGANVLTAALVLGLVALPTVAVLATAALDAVDPGQVRAAAALGLSTVAILRAVVWPSARGPLLGAVLLGLGRALGETVVVLLVSGNVAAIPTGPLAPARTLTANMALELGYARGEHRTALFASGALLLALYGGIVAIAPRGRP